MEEGDFSKYRDIAAKAENKKRPVKDFPEKLE